MSKLLKAEQVAEMLQISKRTVATWANNGRLTKLTAGDNTRIVRFSEDEIKNLFKKHGS